MEDKKEKKLPSKELTLEIGSNSYTVAFPKNGMLIDIEAMKITTSGGAHKDMQFGSQSAQLAWLLTEAIATFTYLIPDLKKHLLVQNLYEVDVLDSASLIKAYKKFAVWYKEWQDVINEALKEEE